MDGDGSLGDIWIRGFFDRNDALCLSCPPAEYSTHAAFVTKLIESGIDPEHFMRSLSSAKANSKKTEPDGLDVCYTLMDIVDGESVQIEVRQHALDWLLDQFDGMIEYRLERLEIASALLLHGALKRSELKLSDVVDALGSEGEDFRLE